MKKQSHQRPSRRGQVEATPSRAWPCRPRGWPSRRPSGPGQAGSGRAARRSWPSRPRQGTGRLVAVLVARGR
ncbi:hypothetical protein GQ55_1G076600 [Panicum hallii var. hallii]|uniref:Uncharacterized protein n=1 Tax=Panicum hallii var. hallii TaxID=1504633 RepID=A0A2T7F3D9_9POAL|nr:hypothetical protein GQ55_1G076600 [Panicum hallii var. hallii]